MSTLYDGQYPVDEEFIREHLGEEVAFVYTMDLADLIDVAGIEGMNDYLDSMMGTFLADLTDIRYFQHTANPDDELDDFVLIRAEGILEGGGIDDEDEEDQ